jgi:hypothetical protein
MAVLVEMAGLLRVEAAAVLLAQISLCLALAATAATATHELLLGKEKRT